MRIRYLFLSFSVFTAFTAFMPGGSPTAIRGSSPTQSSIAREQATTLRSGEIADRRLALGATTTSLNERISKKVPKRSSPSPIPTTTGVPVPSPTGTPSSIPSVSADCSRFVSVAGAGWGSASSARRISGTRVA